MQHPRLIDLHRVTHRFGRHGPPILSDVSLRIGKGERVAVIGRSGCGKSTLLQIMAGLAQPSDGDVSFALREAGTPIRRTLMFQRPLLFPWLDVAGNVALALRFDSQRREAEGRVQTLLAQVGLANRGGANVRELSGGQQQRVALARSLAVDPEALLLDEPFSALDPLTRAGLRRQLLETQQAFGFAIVLVTHDVDDVLDLAERVVVMAAEPGRIVAKHEIPQQMNAQTRAELRIRLLDSLEPEPIALAVA